MRNSELARLRSRKGGRLAVKARVTALAPGWKSSYNSSPDLIAMIGSGHKIIKVNKALAGRLGLNPAESVGSYCYQIIHSLEAPPDFCPHSRTLQGGGTETEQIYSERLGGHFQVTTMPVRSDGAPVSASVHVARDITRQVEAEAALCLNQEQLSLVTQTMRLGIWEWRARPGLVFVTDPWREITGFDAPREGFKLALWLNRIHPEDAEQLHKHFQALIDGQSDFLQEELEVLHPQKGIIWLSRTAAVVGRDGQGRAVRVIGFHQDVTDRKNLTDELERLAMTDALTGMGTHRYFMDRAAYEFLRSNRYQRPFSVALLDIDQLQKINENHDQNTGDEVIRVLARTCQSALRKTDIQGRMGGKKFAVLFLETQFPKVLEACERLRAALARASATSDSGPVNFTVSLGVSSVATADGSVEDIIERADRALQKARQKGGNRVVFYREE